MADIDVENVSCQIKVTRKKKKKSKQEKSEEGIKGLSSGPSKLTSNSGSNSGLQEEEGKCVSSRKEGFREVKEGSNRERATEKKRKIDMYIGTSSLIKDNEIREIFNDVGSGQLKRVKRAKQKGKAKRILSDCDIAKNEFTIPTENVEANDHYIGSDNDLISTTDESSVVHPAISYLIAWKKNRNAWSFKKSRQVWLLKNMYDVTKLSNKHFKILKKHLKDLKGKSREETLAQARKIMEKADEGNILESGKKVQRKRAEKVVGLLA